MIAAMTVAGCGDLTLNPSSVEFGSDTYEVRRQQEGEGGFVLASAHETVRLRARPGDARHLAPCPPPSLIVHDFDGDRRPDLALYTCSFLEIYIQGSAPLGATAAVEAKFKEGRWIRIDRAEYPGLDDLTPDFVRRLDPDA